MKTEAHSIFGDSADKVASMASHCEQGFTVLLNTLMARIENHESQYVKLCDGLVMEGDNRKVLVKAAHVRGELANTKFILRELEGVLKDVKH